MNLCSGRTPNFLAAQRRGRETMSKWNRDKARDTGLALVLVILLFCHFGEKYGLIPLAIAVLLVVSFWPQAFGPIARVWFGLARIVGDKTSKILLAILFYGLVAPVGILRRCLGKDSLQLRRWKKGKGSVFRKVEHRYLPQDLERPY